MLLMIDNYDSFTYNLVQYFGELGEDVPRCATTRSPLPRSTAMKPDRLVLSPGPCSPAEAGIWSPRSATSWASCRSWACAWGTRHRRGLGGDIVRAKVQMHGKADTITTTGRGVRRAAQRSASSATTRWRSRVTRCRPIWKSPPPRPTARSWACATATLAAGGRAVPPRIHPQRARPRDAEELPANALNARAERNPGDAHADHQHRSADPCHRAPRDLPRRDAHADAPHHERRDVAHR
jgi:anthranilate/para-aminobenzoate synthase component II